MAFITKHRRKAEKFIKCLCKEGAYSPSDLFKEVGVPPFFHISVNPDNLRIIFITMEDHLEFFRIDLDILAEGEPFYVSLSGVSIPTKKELVKTLIKFLGR